MSFTGWNARKFGLIVSQHSFLVKMTAIFSLFFGCLLAFFSPFIFAPIYGLRDSYEPIIVLIVMFLPSIITSFAIVVNKNTV